MIKAKATIKLNDSAIDKIMSAKIKTVGIVLEALKTDVSQRQVVPFADGTLKDSVTTGYLEKADHVIGWIGWNTPYARRLYFHPEYNFRKDKHINAMGLWMDFYMNGPGRVWLDEAFVNALKIASGGVVK